MEEFNLEYWQIERLIPYARNPRKNDHAVDRVAAAIREFGFRVPVVAKSDGTVVDGHLRIKAAQKLGMDAVPVILADDMTDTQIKAFRISVNRMAELAEWDDELLKLELEDLETDGFDLELTGFDLAELNTIFGEEPQNEPPGEKGFNYQETYAVIVTCANEEHQRQTYDDLVGRGYDCKVLVN